MYTFEFLRLPLGSIHNFALFLVPQKGRQHLVATPAESLAPCDSRVRAHAECRYDSDDPTNQHEAP